MSNSTGRVARARAALLSSAADVRSLCDASSLTVLQVELLTPDDFRTQLHNDYQIHATRNDVHLLLKRYPVCNVI